MGQSSMVCMIMMVNQTVNHHTRRQLMMIAIHLHHPYFTFTGRTMRGILVVQRTVMFSQHIVLKLIWNLVLPAIGCIIQMVVQISLPNQICMHRQIRVHRYDQYLSASNAINK